MHNLPRVILSANTRCCRCGGNLFEGQQVTVIWDTDLDGWKHRHPRSGLCHHRNRNLDHMEVMEAIYGTCNTDPADATKTRYFNQKCSSFVDKIPISKQQVTVIWDEQIDGYKHKHSRRGLCHHRNRAVEIMEVIEVINAQRHPAPEA